MTWQFREQSSPPSKKVRKITTAQDRLQRRRKRSLDCRKILAGLEATLKVTHIRRHPPSSLAHFLTSEQARRGRPTPTCSGIGQRTMLVSTIMMLDLRVIRNYTKWSSSMQAQLLTRTPRTSRLPAPRLLSSVRRSGPSAHISTTMLPPAPVSSLEGRLQVLSTPRLLLRLWEMTSGRTMLRSST